MFQLIKYSVFHAAKLLGLFALSRRIYRHKVRILCYHGFTLRDEHLFVPGLFITPETFTRRMNYLKRKGYRVQSLQQVCAELASGDIERDSVVLTIDDGFYSTLKLAAPVLAGHGFPATLYLTSYYFDESCPIFTLAVDYLFWKSTVEHADFGALEVPGLTSAGSESLEPAREAIKTFGQALADNDQRERLLQGLADILEVSYDALKSERLLTLVNEEEAQALQDSGVDIQLHSHRHRFPTTTALARREIDDNRSALAPFARQTLNHFCYPSGEWDSQHWPVLTAAGVLTATTCESGLVDADTPPLAMNRILDSARVSQIEFEAEVSGFNELVRQLRHRR